MIKPEFNHISREAEERAATPNKKGGRRGRAAPKSATKSRPPVQPFLNKAILELLPEMPKPGLQRAAGPGVASASSMVSPASGSSGPFYAAGGGIGMMLPLEDGARPQPAEVAGGACGPMPPGPVKRAAAEMQAERS